jgi:mannose-6-phosphate isomerase-like protein (cupin superfamily)
MSMPTALLLSLFMGAGPSGPGGAAQLPAKGATIDRAGQPVHLIAGGKGGARVLLDGRTAPGLKEAAMTELVMLPGAEVPEHAHDASAELIYVIEGHAAMTMDGKPVEVRAGMAIYIPAGVKHSLRVDTKVEPLRAVQVYTPGGPEQRFVKEPEAQE